MSKDWYVVYDCHDGDGRDVMTVSGEFAATANDAAAECLASFVIGPAPHILLVTQNPDDVPDDLTLIDLDDIDPGSLTIPPTVN